MVIIGLEWCHGDNLDFVVKSVKKLVFGNEKMMINPKNILIYQ